MDLWEEEAALGTLARRTHQGAWLLRVSRVTGDQGGLWGCHVVVTGHGGTSRLCPA